MPQYSALLNEDLIELREYQDVIARKAVLKNTLVVIPTALGKTIIAIIAISIAIEGGGKALFLAPTRPLVHQHATSLKKFLSLDSDDIVEVTGLIKKEDRINLYGRGRVIVSTPQVINNDAQYLSPLKKEITMVVFDEAHRAIGDYSYVNVASSLSNSRILATTASPGGDREKINQIIKNLNIENLEIRDETSPDVVPYIKEIQSKQVNIPMPPGNLEIISQLREILEGIISKLESFSLKIHGPSRKELIALGEVISYQIRTGNKNFFNAAKLRTYAITVDYLLEFAETQGILPFQQYLKETKESNTKSKKIFKDPMMISVEKRAALLSSGKIDMHTPKFSKIIELLSNETYQKAIIFCHYRITANMLTDVLKSRGFSCERFIGQSSRKENKGMSQKEQASILEMFRGGSVRILVATQIGEEGLDVPAADVVIFHEPVPSEVRLIQRRGRTGRFGKGRVFILTMENSRDISYYFSSGRKERKMKDILKDGKKHVQTTFDTFPEGNRSSKG